MPQVVVRSYSPDWPAAFRRAREELLRVFADGSASVEHIGSTAVPGLAAKPVIDVLLGAPSLAHIEARVGALAEAGYAYRPDYEREIPDRRYFVRARPPELRLHLHAVERGAHLWRQHLAFRDALRADPVLRAEYLALKLRLAREHADDKAMYTLAKAPFIRRVLADSLEDPR